MQGMFGMLNQAINASPLTGRAGTGLLDTASMGLGGAMGTAMGRDPTSFMSQSARATHDARQQEEATRTAQTALRDIDYSNPDSIEQVAQVMMQAGRMEEAEKLMSRAQALRAKNASVLEAGNEGIQEEAARKREMVTKRQAIALARKNGDPDIAQAIQAGTITAEAYMTKVMEEQKLYELSKGEMLTDKDGNIIRINPDTGVNGSPDLSVHDKKTWDTLTTDAYEREAWANKLDALSEQVSGTDWKAGAYATVEDYMLTLLGKRDDPQYLRTQVNAVRNHEGIGMLPKGPASDKDIALVMKGVPPANAGKEEVLEFLQANARVARRLTEYDKMRADYTIRQMRGQFQEDWDRKMAREARSEKIAATPDAAVQALRENPSQEMKDFFVAKYGWLPQDG